ncbi:hypothetical protein DL239_15875 [Sedimentitalea sp. CY04]|uniref:Guanylate cyclase domain-containing protein n=1 Tax=Parasedimentitalea denitrificans TaxID=2211118 RepID=A0ABX0WCN7_9RHOB|nr:hypothetical protein [Sedimentitalea sp. CY04]
MKVRLQVGVATAFTIITVVMLGIVVAFLYAGNRELALQTARKEMLEARNLSVSAILEAKSQTGRVVDVIASSVAEFPKGVRSLETLNVLHALIRGDEQFYGVYFGLEDSGAFYQNIALTEDVQTFGPNDSEVPKGIKRVLRVIDGPDDARVEQFFWATDDGYTVKFAEGSVDFDPRKRPWYEGALEKDGLFVTDLYRFESTGRPGVTFAKRILDKTGAVIGVAGADITMSTILKNFEAIRIGDEGLVFMMNQDDQLTLFSGTRASGDGAQFVNSGAEGQIAVENGVIAAAISHWTENRDPFFRFSTESDHLTFIGSVAPIPEMFGSQPIIGFAVPEDEFVGAIKQTTTQVLKISAGALALAILITVLVARMLSQKLRLVADEARRIREFDLTDDLDLRSSIREVSDLNQAMSSMKAGLGSFGAYVPKELVRSIISKGEKVAVGGQSREVTIMFSDLQGFTTRTENLEPEALMPALSEYFETMEKQVTAHSGIVDKYIGDAVMALWNAQKADDKHCENACQAVLACQRAEAEINASNLSSPLVPLHTRFGLHCGTVIVGNVGSLSRMQYTALGSSVNLASRVEGLGKVYGTRALVTEPVVLHTEGLFCVREVDIVSPAGTTKPIRIYELLGEEDDRGTYPASPEMKREVEDWNTCYALYRLESWTEALAAFEDHLGSSSSPMLVDTYIQRCRNFIAHPPDEEWDGVYCFKTK